MQWVNVDGVLAVCGLAGVEPPDAAVVLHHDLVVRLDGTVHVVPWWVDEDGVLHAEDTPNGLARALAWATDRWADRHLFAALLADPSAATLLA
jgi:hypothetical protein